MSERLETARQNPMLPSHAELLERVQILEQALRARDDLLAIAVHELRNPMHTLLLQVTAALQSARCHGDLDMQRRLERIKLIVNRYIKRATVLLDACRNQLRFPLHTEDCDLGKLLAEVVESFEAEAAFNRVTLTVEAPASVPGRWDRMAVEQIISNLLSNAVKYGAGSPVEVRLETLGADRVKLTVRDSGIGIAPEDHARIFEQFERAVAQGENRSGFGIGLWLVRRLVVAHGGTITVDSAVGRGATFTVELPRYG